LHGIRPFGIGALVGMTGVGVGALMTPVLILLFCIHAAAAIGTVLLYTTGGRGGRRASCC
jgi:uncharacterized membrane protein YfcA